MKVSMSDIGMILHGLCMSDYFKSDNIEEAIEQLIADHRKVVPFVPDSQHIEGETLMTLQKQVKRVEYPSISLVSNPESEQSYLGYPFTVPDDPIDFSKLPLDSKF